MIGFGAELACGFSTVSAATVYTDITGLTEICFPEFEVPAVETTHHGSSARTRTATPGLIKPGKCPFELQYTDANYNYLIASLGVAYPMRVRSPDDGNRQAKFTGHFENIKTKFNTQDETAMITGDLSVNSAVTFEAVG